MVFVPIDVNESLRKECLRRNYSPRTIESYLRCIGKFLEWSGKQLGKISKKDVREFLEKLSERELSGNSINVYHMAIKFLFEEVMQRRMKLNISYSKVPEKLPVVLSKDEVRELINAIANSKHKLMISLMYGAGLRVSELTNLRVENLDIEKGFGYVRGGKGNKDRMFLIPKILREEISELIVSEKLIRNNYLFCSNRKTKYSTKSLQMIVRKSAGKAKLKNRISCHTLRHSFATHLIENGYDLGSVQSLLGHKSPETTMIYVHIARPNMVNIKSPIDSF